MTTMEPKHTKRITFFGQPATVGCDGQCHKAWGSDGRPRVLLSINDDNEDDYAYLADHELGAAPVDPGTTEGNDGKPLSAASFPNRWCVRACERSRMTSPGEVDVPLKLNDFTRRVCNRYSRQDDADAAHARGEPDPNGPGVRPLRG